MGVIAGRPGCTAPDLLLLASANRWHTNTSTKLITIAISIIGFPLHHRFICNNIPSVSSQSVRRYFLWKSSPILMNNVPFDPFFVALGAACIRIINALFPCVRPEASFRASPRLNQLTFLRFGTFNFNHLQPSNGSNIAFPVKTGHSHHPAPWSAAHRPRFSHTVHPPFHDPAIAAAARLFPGA